MFFYSRFNYKVGEIFRELMGCTGIGCMTATDYNQAVREKSKCNILQRLVSFLGIPIIIIRRKKYLINKKHTQKGC